MVPFYNRFVVILAHISTTLNTDIEWQADMPETDNLSYTDTPKWQVL